MSIYNAIARSGSNTGAGLNAYARNKYAIDQQEQQNALAMEEKQYQRGRNALADKRYDQQQGRQANADQIAFGKQTLAILSSLPPEQRKQAYIARAQEAAQTVGLPEGFDPEQGWARIESQLPPPQQQAGFTLGKDQTRYDAQGNVIASGQGRDLPLDPASGQGRDLPPDPMEDAKLRKAEADARAAELKAEGAERKSEAAARTKTELQNLAKGLLSEDGKDLVDAVKSVYGAVQGALWSMRPDVIDAEAKVDQLVDMLTLENIDKMAGVLSDTDIKILKNAGSRLSNKRISEKAALEEIRRVAGIVEKAEIAEAGSLERDSSGNVTGNTRTVGGATVTFD